jgi:FAD/FMN-containing dehydrogenase
MTKKGWEMLEPVDHLIEALHAALGPRGMLTDPVDTAPYCEDWRRLYPGRTPAVLRPATTAEVAAAVRLCAEHRVPIVPPGGNTSMAAAAAVGEDGSEIVLSLSRLNRVPSTQRASSTPASCCHRTRARC